MDKKIILIAVALLCIAFLLIHHYYIHRLDVKKSALEKWFQWADINNHETIIIGLIGFILGMPVFWYLK